jgi:hypothetical protein
MLSDEETRKAWRSARSFAALCELMARFVRGDLAWCPGHDAALHADSRAHVSTLVAFNKAGLLTTASQGAARTDLVDDGGLSGQRAFVSGFCEERTAQRFKRLAVASDLLVLMFPPHLRGGVWVPVTVAGSQPYAAVGFDGGDERSWFAESCHQAAAHAVAHAWFVTVVDPVWGRDAHLWADVSRALAREFDPVRDGEPVWPDFLPH